MYGENLAAALVPSMIPEPPPRVRGKLSGGFGSEHDSGATPACTGKTTVKCHKRNCQGSHPRVYGENAVDNDDLTFL